MKNLENQVGQLALAIHTRPQGYFPSNTENPREGKEQVQAIQLRNGRELQMPRRMTEPEQPSVEHQSNEAEIEVQEPVEKSEKNKVNDDNIAPAKASIKKQQIAKPIPPYPQRLKKQNQDKQFGKFLEVLKQFHINIPLVEALEQMPNYVKFMKDILSKKRKMSEFEIVAMTKECSSILQNKLPQKLKDPGSFTLSCSIGNTYCGRALCDLGASINLMPLSLFEKLGIGEARPTTVMLQLADRSFVQPEGKIEDVLVRVDKFIFHLDFIILDYEADREVPIILGRSFLAIRKTLIDVQKGELTMRVNNQEVTFSVLEALKFPDDSEECSAVSILDNIVMEDMMKCCSNWTEDINFENEESKLNDEEEMTIRTTELPECLMFTDYGPTFEMIEQNERNLKPLKPSIEEPPMLEQKMLHSHLKYAYLGEGDTLPIIISSTLSEDREQQLLKILKQHKKAFGWSIADIKGISPSICMHKIMLEDDCCSIVEHQRRLNPAMKEVFKKEILKWLDAGIIYPISDSDWISLVQCVPKKGGITVVKNQNEELISTRTITGWRICMDYRKLNKATRNDHFPLPFID